MHNASLLPSSSREEISESEARLRELFHNSREFRPDVIKAVEDHVSRTGLAILDETDHNLECFVVLQSCAHIEITLRACVDGFILSRCGEPLYSYFMNEYPKGFNPRYERIIDYVQKFDRSEVGLLKDKLKQYRDNLKSLVDYRNKIAHGANIPPLGDIESYFNLSLNVSRILQEYFDHLTRKHSPDPHRHRGSSQMTDEGVDRF